jgi:hypothetical protein
MFDCGTWIPFSESFSSDDSLSFNSEFPSLFLSLRFALAAATGGRTPGWISVPALGRPPAVSQPRTLRSTQDLACLPSRASFHAGFIVRIVSRNLVGREDPREATEFFELNFSKMAKPK